MAICAIIIILAGIGLAGYRTYVNKAKDLAIRKALAEFIQHADLYSIDEDRGAGLFMKPEYLVFAGFPTTIARCDADLWNGENYDDNDPMTIDETIFQFGPNNSLAQDHLFAAMSAAGEDISLVNSTRSVCAMLTGGERWVVGIASPSDPNRFWCADWLGKVKLTTSPVGSVTLPLTTNSGNPFKTSPTGAYPERTLANNIAVGPFPGDSSKTFSCNYMPTLN